MKAKLIPALLLSFVMVAGAVTINDAYAQTNTERLATVDETTMDNNDLLMAISSAIDTMTNSVMEMLMSISDAISGVDDNVSAVNDNVSAVNDNVNDLTGHVSNVTASVDGLGADVSAVANDVSAVDSKLDGLMTALATFGSQVVSTSDIENLHEEIEGQADTLSDISESLVSASDISDAVSDANAENAATLDRIVRGITNNAAKLNQLETMLNKIQMDADMDREAAEEAVMAAVPDPITMLYSGEITHTVYQRNFGDAVSGKIPTKDSDGRSTYEAAFELVCDEDVFLNTVKHTIKPDDDGDSVFPYNDEGYEETIGRTVATLHIGGIPLYQSDIARLDGSPVSLDRSGGYSLDRMALAAGDALHIKTTYKANHDYITGLNGYVMTPFGKSFTVLTPVYTITDGTTENKYIHSLPVDKQANPHRIMNSTIDPYKEDDGLLFALFNYTKAAVGNIESFTMTISWLSANEASCEIMQAGSFADLTKSDTEILKVTTDDDDTQLIKEFTGALNCNNVPTIINDIRTEVPGGVTLPQYSTLTLFTGDNLDDDDAKIYASFGFASNGTLTPNIGELPFTFGGDGPLKITGSLAQETNLLVVVDYTTTEGNSCN